MIKIKICQIIFSQFRYFYVPHKTVLNQKVGICSVLSHQHLDMYLFSIMSFFYHTKQSFPIFIISDGTLTSEDFTILKRLFSATVLSDKEANENILEIVSQKKYPHFHEYRVNSLYPFKYKFDAILLNPFKKIIFLDSDIIFFRTPKQIIQWLTSTVKYSLFNNHNWTVFRKSYYFDIEHSIRVLVKNHFNKRYIATFNDGLLCIQDKKILNLNRLDEIFKYFEKSTLDRSPGAQEIALGIALCERRLTYPLPQNEYVVACFQENYWQGKSYKKVKAIHYANRSKAYYIPDAVKHALKTKLFGLFSRKSH